MKNGARAALLSIGDVIMLTTSFFAMLEVAFPGAISSEITQSHFLPFMFVFGIWLLVFFLFGLYETQSIKPTIPNFRKIGFASITALSGSTILFYVIPSFGITPKTNLVIFSVTFVLLFIVWRRIFYKIFSAYFRRNTALVVDREKDGPYVQEIENYMENYPQSGYFIVGKYSSLQDFAVRANTAPVDTLIVSRNKLGRAEDVKLIYNTVENISDLAYAYEDMLGKIPVDSIDETWFLHNLRGAGRNSYEMVSKIINILVALIILVISSPFLLVAALLIKLGDNGPVFYSQARVGKNGKNFTLYKFRSMTVGADKNGAEWTEKNDPRITRIGKIIRALHIDEIPQLLNVLRGEMALVGPRPEIPSFAEKLEREIPHYNLRHIIIPGFTGWAQIKWRNARGIAESKEKFEYDLYYIKNRNIFMDFGILLRTVIIIFTHD